MHIQVEGRKQRFKAYHPTVFEDYYYSIYFETLGIISLSLNSTKYSISFYGPKLWNEILHKEEKELESYSLFQNIIKSKLLMIENESKYF